MSAHEIYASDPELFEQIAAQVDHLDRVRAAWERMAATMPVHLADAVEENQRDRGIAPDTAAFFGACIAEASEMER